MHLGGTSLIHLLLHTKPVGREVGVLSLLQERVKAFVGDEVTEHLEDLADELSPQFAVRIQLIKVLGIGVVAVTWPLAHVLTGKHVLDVASGPLLRGLRQAKLVLSTQLLQSSWVQLEVDFTFLIHDPGKDLQFLEGELVLITLLLRSPQLVEGSPLLLELGLLDDLKVLRLK